MVSTATSLGGFQFDNCLMNAGWCLVYDQGRELNEVKQSLRERFVTKTATLEYRSKSRTTVPECLTWLY